MVKNTGTTQSASRGLLTLGLTVPLTAAAGFLTFRLSKRRKGVKTTIVVVVLVGIGAFLYQQAIVKPSEPSESVYNEWVIVRIVSGSFNPNQAENFKPKETTILIGVNNTITWINQDQSSHSIVGTDNQFHLLS